MDVGELSALLAPHIMIRRHRFITGGRLVHYTTAETAFKILTSREIWMRNASMMNDFSEIEHGINCLAQSWTSDAGKSLKAMLDRLKPGMGTELEQLFDGHADGFRIGTYITSLSEHDDDEDLLGRLSMWRAYGGRAGVALVLNNTAFAGTTDAMGVFSSPVFYQNVEVFRDWFAGWAGDLIAAEGAFSTIDPEVIRNWMFLMFRNFALCTKHPGFAEEKEWRVYHSPVHEGSSDWIEPATVAIGGIPQLLMRLSLHDAPDRGISGVSPPALVNRVIIGPCDHPLQVRAALASAMAGAGIENPLERMWMSYIPLRQSAA